MCIRDRDTKDHGGAEITRRRYGIRRDHPPRKGTRADSYPAVQDVYKRQRLSF